MKWPLYLFEAAELAIFMISACVFTVLLFDPALPLVSVLPSAATQRAAMGVAMGVTAILIIRSPIGKRSGAHLNPAITLTYLRLGKISAADSLFYVIFQLAGGIAGVGISAVILGSRITDPEVKYAVTVPGVYGTAAAFVAELFMAALLMAVVLWASNRPNIANYTSYGGGVDRALYFVFRTDFGIQHQSSQDHGIGPLRRIMDGLLGLLHSAASRHVGRCEGVFARGWTGSDSLRKASSGSPICVSVYCRNPLHRHQSRA